MLDYWTAEVIGRLYKVRRELSAPELSGIRLKTRVPSSSTDWEAGENSHWWSGFRLSLEQADAAALRKRIEPRAADLGLKIRSFHAPQLDGVLAPVVTLQVSDGARFKQWYDPGCAEGWLFGPRTNASPFFGWFLTVVGSSGNWLGSVAAIPNSTSSEYSTEMRTLFPPHVAPGQFGIASCPARFNWR